MVGLKRLTSLILKNVSYIKSVLWHGLLGGKEGGATWEKSQDFNSKQVRLKEAKKRERLKEKEVKERERN